MIDHVGCSAMASFARKGSANSLHMEVLMTLRWASYLTFNFNWMATLGLIKVKDAMLMSQKI